MTEDVISTVNKKREILGRFFSIKKASGGFVVAVASNAEGMLVNLTKLHA